MAWMVSKVGLFVLFQNSSADRTMKEFSTESRPYSSSGNRTGVAEYCYWQQACRATSTSLGNSTGVAEVLMVVKYKNHDPLLIILKYQRWIHDAIKIENK